jgi:tetratricopeptide (TPR) repeat protein
VLDADAGWAGVAVGELLRASLGRDGRVLIVDGETSARAARELGVRNQSQMTEPLASAWRRRLGVEQLLLLSTTDAANGEVAVAISSWPAAAAPLREQGSERELVELAGRLDARVRAAWAWPARATGDRSAGVSLPSGAALRPYAEGLLLHRQGDEAGALARWMEAVELAPDNPLLLTTLAQAQTALGRPRAARPIAERATKVAATLPPAWRQQIESRARLPARDVEGALRGGAIDDPALARALIAAQRENGDLKGAATTLALARARPLLSDDEDELELEAARLSLAEGDGEAARRLALKAARAAAARGANTLVAKSRRVESAAWLVSGDVAQARRAAAAAVEAAAKPGVDGDAEVDALLALGVAQSASGASGPGADDTAAENSFTRALARARELGELDRAARSLGDLATLAARAGRHDDAARWLAELADAARKAGELDAEAAARRDRAALTH